MVWCGAAALLLPAAWLPSASTLPLAAEVALTAAVAVAGVLCAARSAVLTRAQGRGMVEGACRAASSKWSKLDLQRKALEWLSVLEA